MKIGKERNIKKIKISHNKRLFWIIIVLTAIFFVLILFIAQKNEEQSKIPECERDSDCLRVSVGCCPCHMGGEEKCIPVSEKERYGEKLNCEGTVCTALYNCNIESCLCVNKKCVPTTIKADK